MSGEVVHAADQDQSDGLSILVYGLEYIFLTDGRFPLPRTDLDHPVLRIEAVEFELRRHRILVRWERFRFQQDLITIFRRAIEGDHQQMEIDGERVHDDHLRRLGPHKSGGFIGKRCLVQFPRPLAGVVSAAGSSLPHLHLFPDELHGPCRLEPH